ncbi:hypothetical protein [Nonomuraea sp. KM90]|uniref:hypothetical protein n=1 Tax=Nonomuraea sp. KM90 TaxID=3457428 RepID=UPI003FCE5441
MLQLSLPGGGTLAVRSNPGSWQHRTEVAPFGPHTAVTICSVSCPGHDPSRVAAAAARIAAKVSAVAAVHTQHAAAGVHAAVTALQAAADPADGAASRRVAVTGLAPTLITLVISHAAVDVGWMGSAHAYLATATGTCYQLIGPSPVSAASSAGGRVSSARLPRTSGGPGPSQQHVRRMLLGNRDLTTDVGEAALSRLLTLDRCAAEVCTQAATQIAAAAHRHGSDASITVAVLDLPAARVAHTVCALGCAAVPAPASPFPGGPAESCALDSCRPDPCRFSQLDLSAACAA